MHNSHKYTTHGFASQLLLHDTGALPVFPLLVPTHVQRSLKSSSFYISQVVKSRFHTILGLLTLLLVHRFVTSIIALLHLSLVPVRMWRFGGRRGAITKSNFQNSPNPFSFSVLRLVLNGFLVSKLQTTFMHRHN